MTSHQPRQDGRSNAYWARLVLDDGTVFRVVFYADQVYRLRDRWLKDGTRDRTYGGLVNVVMDLSERTGGSDGD